MSIHGAAFDRAQAAYDRQLPPDDDDTECPECGGLLEEDGDGWKCTGCDWAIYPDYSDDEYDGILGEG